MLVDGICVIKMIKKYALKMQVHDVFYDLEFPKWKSPQLNQFKQKWRGDLKPSLMLGVTQLVEYVTNGLLWCINFFFLECNYFFFTIF